MPSPRVSIQLLLLAAIAFAGACKKGVPGGDITASLALPTTTDATFDPGTLKGKPTLVLFASPTCGHCFKELPVAQTAAAAEDANVVAVFVVGSKQQAASMASRAKYTATALVDPSGGVRKKYEIEAVPYLLVLGPDGHARESFTGEQDESTLRSALASAR
jgi:thiol-disulfide isomerase/thioredoxin